jgi:hypothetical protein
MAQVVVTFAEANVFGKAPVYAAYGAKTQELSSSGTHAPTTTALASEGDYCRVSNNGSGVIWATAAGAAATATVAGATCYVIGPASSLDIGPCKAGDRASVIDDS